MLEVGEAPLVGGITTVLGAAEEVDLFLLRPKGWKDLNREFMRSMYGERPKEVGREGRERREKEGDARGKGSRDS